MLNTTFQLNWMRESGKGHLEADLGTIVAGQDLELAIAGLLPEQQPGNTWIPVKFSDLLTPWNLPEWAQRRIQDFFGADPTQEQLTLLEGFCNRIRDKAWNIEQTELYLPYLGRREWNERFSILPEIGFERSGDGVVADGVKPHSLREVALRTAAGVFSQSPPSTPVRFRSTIPLIAPWRAPLLERYRLEVPESAPALAELTIESQGNGLAAWLNTPRERNSHYYDIFSPLALAVQYAARRWMLAAYALGPDELADFEIGGDVLVYAATRPHAEKRVRDFSYDVLNAEMMDTAFSRAARRVRPLLKLAYKSLMKAGREDDARCYLRDELRPDAKRLAQRAQRRNRVRGMLVTEGVLIYSMIRFASRLKSLDSAQAVTAAVNELTHDFDERIRRLFFVVDKPEEFATMIFLEASNALHCAMGGEQVMRVKCATTDGVTYENVGPLFEYLAPI